MSQALGGVLNARRADGEHVQRLEALVLEAEQVVDGVVVKKEQLKDHICIVLNLTVVNPTFGSQTKEKLITPAASMGLQEFSLSGATLRALEKYGIVDLLKVAQDALRLTPERSDTHQVP